MSCYDCSVDSSQLQEEPKESTPVRPQIRTIALVGNPNVGKTSLFNALTGLRARTANFPGTTVERSVSRVRIGAGDVEVVDLPGIYSLEAATAEERIAGEYLRGNVPEISKPDLIVACADADNIERSLFLVSQLIERKLPIVVALNMVDVAKRHGISVDTRRLSGELGCPVVPTVARSGQGVESLKQAIADFQCTTSTTDAVASAVQIPCGHCASCPFQSRYTWSEQIASRCVHRPPVAIGRRTEQIDRLLADPVLGVAAFFLVMLTVFYLIFSAAAVPMALIDALFAQVGAFVATLAPAGKIQSLLSDGVIGGVGGMLVFLPQIFILFFFLAMLEDSGYLARAAFVMDRLMRRIGLPGTAFVPLVSAHACAIPAIMATRVIRDPRDRLVTILVIPLMTCSARIPVYAMMAAMLFPSSPGRAALLFAGGYGIGILAALAMAVIFKKTILPGESKPLVLELPDYRVPSLRAAFIHAWDRSKVFVQQAGTVILGISILLWTLATYPSSEPSPAALQLKRQAELHAAQGQTQAAIQLREQADNTIAQEALFHSYAGRLGRFIEPVVRPLGFDWQIGVGIISSFAAREVIVSTLAIVYGVGADAAEEEPGGLYATLRQARRVDGSPVFTTATCLSLMVFYVLAMQCLPTQAVTRRETNSWRWPLFQLGYMTVLAYVASLITYQALRWFHIT